MPEPHSPILPGIHHISAICGDPQRNLDFYVGLLGLRLVKKTVNFDDPGSYHLYYGDGLGSPGSILTFFVWILAPMVRASARQGTGQISATPLWVPKGSLDFWIDRFSRAGVEFDAPEMRFGESVLSFQDPDGLPLELVSRAGSELRASWAESPVPAEHAIRGFSGATLQLDGYERTAHILRDTLGFQEIGQEGSRFRFQIGTGGEEAIVDLLCHPEGEPGRMGIGAVHHIAWRARDPAAQREWRQLLIAAGLDATPVLDRKYFESIYFREPGGVLFEIATDGPGFGVDEAPQELGTHLELPDWLEPRRERLEAKLPPVRIPTRRTAAGGA